MGEKRKHRCYFTVQTIWCKNVYQLVWFKLTHRNSCRSSNVKHETVSGVFPLKTWTVSLHRRKSHLKSDGFGPIMCVQIHWQCSWLLRLDWRGLTGFFVSAWKKKFDFFFFWKVFYITNKKNKKKTFPKKTNSAKTQPLLSAASCLWNNNEHIY